MTHLLDSNACIDHLRYGAKSLISVRLLAASSGSVVTSSIVVGELYFGALRSRNPVRVWNEVTQFCSQFVSLPVDDTVAEYFARIKAHLTAIGQPIGPYDMLIAATALAHGLILVTHNTADFSRIPGLAIEDWQVP